ncbi:MAG: cytochrome-c peroxidase [Candidatus Kapabacteria bacterium]|nr:cytochrome-c peroxidase [Candidatus Kapabacteria bacterium]
MRRSSSPANGIFATGIAAVALLVLLVGCANEATVAADPEPLVDRPPGFPEQIYPADNQPTPERVALGKRLFYDVRMSANLDVSCATCHDQSKAFTDGLPLSKGTAGRIGARNAPSLANVGYLPVFMREGGVPTLEMQILAPIQEHAEFDMEAPLLAQRLAQDSTLQAMSRLAYGRDLDIWVVTRAIASFERTLVSGRSRADLDQLTDDERRGRNIFLSAGCATCHGGPLYSDNRLACNGLLEKYSDRGRARLTNLPSDEAVFRVPSLRNVGLTAPYLHNGSVSSLREVIDLYNRGGYPHPNKDTSLRPLGLTVLDCASLEAFLRALTDDRFTTNPRFRP